MEDQLAMIIEADIKNEQDCDSLYNTLFLHYKKSRKIYSQLECEYHANILKRKIDRKDPSILEEQHLYDIYFISLKTLGALMNLLMLYP